MIADVVRTSPDQNRPLHLNRVALRSFRHIHELPLGSKPTSSVIGSALEPNAHPCNEQLLLRVGTVPTTSRNCCHQLFAEFGTNLRKLDLGSTCRVEVHQRFRAKAGSNLSLECVVLLKSVSSFTPAANVCVIVANVGTQTIETLLDRTIDGRPEIRPQRIASSTREPLSLPIEVAGEYELRTITSIDPACPGAEAHLLIDTVRVTDADGTKSATLASLSCVGRVMR